MGCALFLLGRRVRAHFTGPLGVDQLPLKPNRWRALRRQFLNCSEQNVNPFAVLLDCPFKLAQLLALFGLGCRKSRERACFAVSFAALYSARNPCSRGRQQVKFFIYARKSTDDEERQMLSIEAQLAELREYATSEGLNPFYIGLFRYAGELHEGKHKPLVSKKLFDEVQNVMARRGRPHKPRKKPLPYLDWSGVGNAERRSPASGRRDTTTTDALANSGPVRRNGSSVRKPSPMNCELSPPVQRSRQSPEH